MLLWVDQQDLKPRFHDATAYSLPMYLGIGIAQCAAMIPGVSRSGASIVAAMLFGADKRAAAEFSFFLAILAPAFISTNSWCVGAMVNTSSKDVSATSVVLLFFYVAALPALLALVALLLVTPER